MNTYGQNFSNIFENIDIHEDWKDFFKNNKNKLNFVKDKLIKYSSTQTFIPSEKNVFRIFKTLSPKDIKVLILTEESYLDTDYIDDTIVPRNCGYGLSSPFFEVPPCIKTMFLDIKQGYCHEYKDIKNKIVATELDLEVEEEEGNKKSIDKVKEELKILKSRFSSLEHKLKKVEEINLKSLCGDLSHWVDQGVFMMNLYLTSPFSPEIKLNIKSEHKSWVIFTFEVLNYLIKNYPDIILVGFGDEANKALKKFTNKKHKDIFFECPDPKKDFSNRSKFVGYNVFIKVNYQLIKMEKEEIDWTPLDKSKDIEYYK